MRLRLLALIAATLLGCETDLADPAEEWLPDGTVEITARLVADTVGTGQVQAEVTLAVPAGTRGSATLRSPCPGVLEISSTGAGGPPRQWSEAAYLHGCKAMRRTVTFRGDQPYQFRTAAYPSSAILGDSLTPGRYHVTVFVVVVELPAGGIRIPLTSVLLQ